MTKTWSPRVTVPGDRAGEVIFTGDVPPGEYEIRGHDDGNRAVLTARQRDTRGVLAADACHRRDRAEEAPERTEAAA